MPTTTAALALPAITTALNDVLAYCAQSNVQNIGYKQADGVELRRAVQSLALNQKILTAILTALVGNPGLSPTLTALTVEVPIRPKDIV
jgi:hypothetical protein